MSVLAALTPPFLVCAAVIAAIVAFLRHEMGRGREDRGGDSEENFGARSAVRGGHDPGDSSDDDGTTSARHDG